MELSIKKSQIKIMAIYLLIPLFTATVLLPCITPSIVGQSITLTENSESLNFLYPKVLQKKFGLLVWEEVNYPPTVSQENRADPFDFEWNAVHELMNQISDTYLGAIESRTKFGSSNIKNLLGLTDRTHVSCHGTYSSTNGPILQLSDGDLYTAIVKSTWSNVGQKSKVVLLSACNSLGHRVHGNPELDPKLGEAIIQTTGVEQVIGYKGEVDCYGAAVFATSFWFQHLWANGANGGVDTTTSFQIARTDLDEIRDALRQRELLVGIITASAIAILIAVLTEGVGAPLVPVVAEIVLGILTSVALFIHFTDVDAALSSAYETVDHYGTSVVLGLTYAPGSGYPGKGNLPW